MNLFVDILKFLKYRLFNKNFRKCSKKFYEQPDITETNIFLSDYQYHPSRTIHDNYKDWICALARQIHTVKTSDRSQMNLKRFLHNIAFSAQLPRKFWPEKNVPKFTSYSLCWFSSCSEFCLENWYFHLYLVLAQVPYIGHRISEKIWK